VRLTAKHARRHELRSDILRLAGVFLTEQNIPVSEATERFYTWDGSAFLPRLEVIPEVHAELGCKKDGRP
jgi:hypothetical protein